MHGISNRTVFPQESDLERAPLSLLGRGTTGEVHKRKWKSAGGLLVAIKIFKSDSSAADCGGLSKLEQFKNETQMLAGLRHQHILT
jgi:serine/threonine protein kinase